MKRWLWGFALILVLICTLMMGALQGAMAEGADAAPVAFDATQIVAVVIVLIGTTLGAVLLWLANKFVMPWVKTSALGKYADEAVRFVEALLGRGGGEEKLKQTSAWVVEMLGKIHVQVNAAEIEAAILAAWQRMNLEQIAAGVKDKFKQ